jgi:hypothetical protein
MSDKLFQEVNLMFETHLTPTKHKLQLRIKDISKDTILPESKSMNYSKVLFDSDMNIYKVDSEGRAILVENENFEAVVMKQE